MSRVTGADLVLRALKQKGVSHLFGLCGDHVNPLFVGARRHGLEMVDVRHEAAAVHMADGWGRVTGRPGVSVVTGGPGHTNSLTGVATAAAAGSPVIAISGSYEVAHEGRLAFQELDQVALMRPVTKWASLVTETARLPEMVAAAYRHALAGRPGPVHLSIPLSVLSQEVDAPRIESEAPPQAPPHPDPAAIREAVERLAAAQRPACIVGSGGFWAGAADALTRFVELTRTPCFTIDLARGLLSDEHPLCFGYADPVLNETARALKSADVILLVGKRLDFRLRFGDVFSPEAVLIQIDIDPGEIGRNRPVQVPVVADAAAALEVLTTEASRRSGWKERPWLEELRRQQKAWRDSWAAGEALEEPPLHPLRLCREIRALLPEDAVIVIDGGDFPQWPRMTLPARRPGHWLRLGGLGTVGAALPLGFAAKLARPEAPVFIFMGDGGMGFYGFELHTAVRFGLNAVIIVGNDQGWGMEREIQGALYGREQIAGCELGLVRYDEIMRALGGHGEFVERPAELSPALTRAIASGKPAVVNVLIRKGTVSPLTAASIAAKRP
ncbi:MAG: thiamine pyrophosphate-binding protein [candidate division NC10 bacterium]|nr:thiamine pyrophosphate-binding protein [candidate division NC10 bacterium]